jgi:hypothetical protein
MTKLQKSVLRFAAVLALGLVACEPQNGGTTTDPAVTAPTETPDAPLTPETTTPDATTP